MKKTLIEKLNQAFSVLPGVGRKSANRFVYYLLEKNRQGGLDLAKMLETTMSTIGQCQRCHSLSETRICTICTNNKRDSSQLCIVGTSSDIDAIEQSQAYQGLYFVLNGYLSPVDGIGVEELQLDQLEYLLNQQNITEVILATNATLEGQITAHYLISLVQNYPQVRLSQIAHGIPLGGELEYADINTISHAISDRKSIDSDVDVF